MAVRLADAVAYLKTDDRELRAGIASAEGALQDAGGRFSNILQGIGQGIGQGIVGIANQALGQVVQFVSDSVGAASDLNETVSKTGELFGEQTNAVLRWAEGAATAFGQSRQQALDAAAQFAIFGRAAGLAGDDLVQFSTEFVQLASDLASFNNTTPEQAIEAIGAALRGESEPLRAYGVLLDDATMRQKALELGLIETTKNALTPQQKVLAAQALIYEQTSAAQGDFARTSSGLANQQRILNAQMEDLKATVGQALLPVMLSLVSNLNGLVQNTLPPLQSFMQERVIPVMGRLGEIINSTVGPALNALVGWFSNVGQSVRSQTDGPLSYLHQWFEQNMPRIQQIVETVLGAIQRFWQQHGEQINTLVTTLLNWIVRLWDTNLRTVLDIITFWLQVFTGDWEGAGQTLQGILWRWMDFIGDIFRSIVQTVRDIWSGIDWGELGRNLVDGIANGIRNAAGWLADRARDAAMAALNAAKRALGIYSPSRVAAAEIGRPFVEGIGRGMDEGFGRLASQLDIALGGLVAGGGRTVTAGPGPIQITINVTGVETAGLGYAARDGVLAALRSVGAA